MYCLYGIILFFSSFKKCSFKTVITSPWKPGKSVSVVLVFWKDLGELALIHEHLNEIIYNVKQFDSYLSNYDNILTVIADFNFEITKTCIEHLVISELKSPITIRILSKLLRYESNYLPLYYCLI